MSILKRLLAGVIGERAADRFRRWQLARTSGYPNWARILDPEPWRVALSEAKGGRKILVATNVGGFLPGATMESLLAVALTLRKAEVHVLLCDRVLPACLESVIKWHRDPARIDREGLTRHLCGSCFAPAEKMYRSLGVAVHRYGENLTPEEIRAAGEISSCTPVAEIGAHRIEGIAVGEHAMAGALRFYARGNLDGEPQAEFVLRSYFRAALLTTYAVQRLLRKHRFECAVFHHGIYVPQGLTGEVARREKVRVVNWNPAYRKKCFIFSHGDTYHHTLMNEPADRWENLPWTAGMETQIMDYLKSRWQGTQDWIWFHEKPEENLKAIARELGVDFSRPCIGMLTNVMWDAQLHYPANAFPSMLDWAVKTIAWFARRPDLQLLVRVHPAEIRGTIPSRQPIIEEIRRAFPTLPKNVFLIPPESQVSTYAAMMACDSVIIYGTKTGVELASLGIPVIVAGEAWIRNKGITLDARTAEDYFKLLDRLPLKERMSEDQVRRARKYAYHFFFRRMIPVDGLEPLSGWPIFRVSETAFEDAAAGRSVGLDVISRGILDGEDFIYPAERPAAKVTDERVAV